MKTRFNKSVVVTGVLCVCASLGAKAQYADTVNLGELPANTVSLTTNSAFTGVAYSNGQYSSTPGEYYFDTGTGPIINGVVTGSPTGAAPAFIYKFSTPSSFNMTGVVDGPFANFQNVDLYSGTPTGHASLLSAGQVICDCGPETPNASFTSLSGGGAAGNYFIELSNPAYPTWGDIGIPASLSSTQPFFAGEGLFDFKLAPQTAPEIDPASAASAVTFFLGALAVIRGRRRKEAD
jgi:hypothetical protein